MSSTKSEREYRLTVFFGGKGGAWGSATRIVGTLNSGAEVAANAALRNEGVRVVIESREIGPWEPYRDSGPALVGCIDCEQTGTLASGRKCPSCKGEGRFMADE